MHLAALPTSQDATHHAFMAGLHRLFATKRVAVCRTFIGLQAIISSAIAHPGHGAAAAHPHATDVWGLIALAAIAATLLWNRRK